MFCFIREKKGFNTVRTRCLGSAFVVAFPNADGKGDLASTASVLAAANAGLPKGCALFVSADNKALLLKVYKDTGTLLSLY